MTMLKRMPFGRTKSILNFSVLGQRLTNVFWKGQDSKYFGSVDQMGFLNSSFGM